MRLLLNDKKDQVFFYVFTLQFILMDAFVKKTVSAYVVPHMGCTEELQYAGGNL